MNLEKTHKSGVVGQYGTNILNDNDLIELCDQFSFKVKTDCFPIRTSTDIHGHNRQEE